MQTDGRLLSGAMRDCVVKVDMKMKIKANAMKLRVRDTLFCFPQKLEKKLTDFFPQLAEANYKVIAEFKMAFKFT